ncbi:MAG: hypothetical protein GX575_20600 [Candidatus Anammoximicrobium sp.]|nr:hypothetical protein [Candidatus Anammoximicrobium sp.]
MFLKRRILSWRCWTPALLTLLVPVTAWAADEPFDYFRNSWNVIGLKDYAQGTRVTPDNRLLLAGGREAQIRVGSKSSPLGRQQVKTLLDGWLPVVLLSVREGNIRYDFRLWATPLPSVSDWRKSYDWPVETENYLNWIAGRATNTGPEAAEANWDVLVRGGGAEATAGAFRFPLQPGQTQERAVRLTFEAADAGPLADESAEVWLERTVQYWRGLLDAAARIEVPCRKATEALRAAHVCQLIANDHGELHGGEGFYDHFYIRDGGYQIMELEEAGLDDAAAKAVEPYLRHQRPDGRFETQTKQFDANGQALWVLWQYARITGDQAWLQRAYPHLRRAADWIAQARREAPADSPLAGLLPAAPADGEYLWDGKHHILGYDFWNLRGLLCVADAAEQLGRGDEARQLRDEADRYRTAIDAAWRRSGLAHFPPSWEQAGTHWGNTETVWPTPVFEADDPRVAATIDHARRVHGGGFVEGTIQWLGGSPAIHPYMSAYTSMASLRRGEHEQVVEDFFWYLLHSTAAHAFPEGIFPDRRFAWSNTIPHVTGASNYALLLRHMLVDERGDELHLLAAVPDGWLAEGQTIQVQRAPTHFGPLDLTVSGTAAGVTVQLKPPARQKPQRIALYLPASRPLVATLPGVDVVVRGDQKKHWDFPAVIDLYRQTAGVAVKPIPGLVAWPLAEPPAPGRCTFLTLDAMANTDPSTAPFGVPKPGKLLFTGLGVGRQTAAGVPFQIVDPARNQGRGLVVLHSPRAPRHIAWPTEVRIPVGAAGKRLFFLGNVHGWSSQDRGTGPWDAVAEYEVVYADGQRQTVPLITGRTIDEWTAEPEADDVQVGLRGSPWHLNVLGVELRDVPVAEVVFRDLGTPAAPVLAAVTLERE